MYMLEIFGGSSIEDDYSYYSFSSDLDKLKEDGLSQLKDKYNPVGLIIYEIPTSCCEVVQEDDLEEIWRYYIGE